MKIKESSDCDVLDNSDIETANDVRSKLESTVKERDSLRSVTGGKFILPVLTIDTQETPVNPEEPKLLTELPRSISTRT